jgi:glycosyltransferase involved in cell wall biosynthesis
MDGTDGMDRLDENASDPTEDGAASADERYHVGFVLEQTLGHRTHAQNLRRFVAQAPDIAAEFLPIAFEPDGLLARLPIARGNWSVQASWLAQRTVRRQRAQMRVAGTRLDALFYHTQVTALLSPLQRDLPVVISLDATPLNYDTLGHAYGHSTGGPLEPLKLRVNRYAFRSAAALVTWCRWAKDSLVRDYGVPAEKISVIAPGVDLAAWPRATSANRRGSDARPPRLLFVGGDFERKGGMYLLECFERHFAERAELHLVTQTPIQPRRNVTIHTGLTPNSAPLLRLFAEADLFVFPTLADCAPLVVPEAMAASLPVIATRVGAIPEMVTNGEQGLLVALGDVDGLRAAIERLLDDAELRARMGAAGRGRAEADYDTARNAARVLDVLRAVVRRSPHSGRSGHVGRPAASGAAVTPAIAPPDGRLQQTGGRRP